VIVCFFYENAKQKQKLYTIENVTTQPNKKNCFSKSIRSLHMMMAAVSKARKWIFAFNRFVISLDALREALNKGLTLALNITLEVFVIFEQKNIWSHDNDCQQIRRME
jgi:hypothetical protein